MQNLSSKIPFKITTILNIIVVFSFLFFISYIVWNSWPTIMLKSIKWQRVIYDELSTLLYQAKEDHAVASVYLLGLSFLYGVLHSVGPGHGKMIVTTFLATHPSKAKHALILTILSAFMQALVAIILVSILVLLFNNSMRDVNAKAAELISISFLTMAGLGAFIIFRAAKKLWDHIRDKKAHQHNHFASAGEINKATTWQAYLGMIVSIGIRPCTGAIMVLLFSNMIGIYWLGIISAIIMAIGTAITTSTIALLTISGKKVINRYLKREDNQFSISNISLQIIGGGILTLVGVLLFNAPTYGISPIF